MTNDTEKQIGVKFIGSQRPTETLTILPGTTTRDILNSLDLNSGFQLSPSNQPETVFNPNDAIFARVEDGDMLACSAMVDAGRRIAA